MLLSDHDKTLSKQALKLNEMQNMPKSRDVVRVEGSRQNVRSQLSLVLTCRSFSLAFETFALFPLQSMEIR